MDFKGISKRADTSDLQDVYSPECTNARNYDDKRGVLGPRSGRRYITKGTSSYDALIMFLLPNGDRKWITAEGGTASVGAAQQTSESTTSNTTGELFLSDTNPSVTVTEPATLGTITSNFTYQGTILDATKNILVPFPSITASGLSGLKWWFAITAIDTDDTEYGDYWDYEFYAQDRDGNGLTVSATPDHPTQYVVVKTTGMSGKTLKALKLAVRIIDWNGASGGESVTVTLSNTKPIIIR